MLPAPTKLDLSLLVPWLVLLFSPYKSVASSTVGLGCVDIVASWIVCGRLFVSILYGAAGKATWSGRERAGKISRDTFDSLYIALGLLSRLVLNFRCWLAGLYLWLDNG